METVKETHYDRKIKEVCNEVTKRLLPRIAHHKIAEMNKSSPRTLNPQPATIPAKYAKVHSTCYRRFVTAVHHPNRMPHTNARDKKQHFFSLPYPNPAHGAACDINQISDFFEDKRSAMK